MYVAVYTYMQTYAPIICMCVYIHIVRTALSC